MRITNIESAAIFWWFIALKLVVCLSLSGVAHAETDDFGLQLCATQQGEVFATRGDFVLMDSDLDRFAQTIPLEHRAGTLASPARLEQIINNLSLEFATASMAVDSGLDRDEVVQSELLYAMVRVLSERYLSHHFQSQKLDNYRRQAEELYLRDPDRFTRGRRYVSFDQILIAPESGKEIDAIRKVLKVAEYLEKEAFEFVALVRRFSDDPTAEKNLGSYEGLDSAKIAHSLLAVLDTLEPGEISPPVRSEFGWHFIRLVGWESAGTPGFVDVEAQYLELARTRHEKEIKERLLRQILSEPYEIRAGGVGDFFARHGVKPVTENLD